MPRDSHTPAGRYVLALVIDSILVLATAAILFVALTGGGVFSVRGVRISMTSTGNPAALLAVLGVVRYCFFRSVPFAGLSRWTPADVDDAAALLLARLASGTGFARARLLLVSTLAVSVLLRLVNAWAHPGFTTGDDVEIHYMTVGRLFGESWDVWNLRNPLFPMTFVYPFQALALAIAGDDMHWLVFAGRLGVVLIATVTVWLAYLVTLRLTNSPAAGVLAAMLLAASRLHLWYGSSELPRPVASAFILAAFLALITGRDVGRAAIAGALLGAGGALRFGELVFFAPASVHLALERRWRDAIVMGISGVVTAAVCLGVADWLYWGRPFFSLINVVDYTLVQGASSRGFQPAWYYVVNTTEWTNFVFLGLGLIAIVQGDRRITLWIWIPVLLLSLLPHKEARYVIAVLPFVCIGAAALLANPEVFHSRALKTIAVCAVVIALAFELSNWRFRRSDDAVALAQRINAMRPSGLAAQQLWRLGGRLYLRDVNGPLVDIQEPIEPTEFLQHGVQVVLVLRRFAGPELRDQLTRRGYTSADALSTPQYVAFLRD